MHMLANVNGSLDLVNGSCGTASANYSGAK